MLITLWLELLLKYSEVVALSRRIQSVLSANLCRNDSGGVSTGYCQSISRCVLDQIHGQIRFWNSIKKTKLWKQNLFVSKAGSRNQTYDYADSFCARLLVFNTSNFPFYCLALIRVFSVESTCLECHFVFGLHTVWFNQGRSREASQTPIIAGFSLSTVGAPDVDVHGTKLFNFFDSCDSV